MPMRTLAQGDRNSALAGTAAGAISFHDVDHGDIAAPSKAVPGMAG